MLSPTWSDGTYYDYGWLIPPLVILFAWRRWQDLDLDHDPASFAPFPQRWPWLVVAAGVLLLWPLRIIEHVDVYWRLPLWAHTAVVLVLTHLVLLLVYGRRISLALLPVTLFALLAVPLPSSLEAKLVQSLTDQVVNLASALLPLAGYPVDVAGNALLVRGELLDVAEGCSGIRSFQSSAMAALCLGELLRLHAWKRTALVFLALGLAVLFNAGRIFVLARIAHDEGRPAMDAAHDGVGFWVLVLTYGSISLAAWLLTCIRKRRKSVVKAVGR